MIVLIFVGLALLLLYGMWSDAKNPGRARMGRYNALEDERKRAARKAARKH